jgi:hypothetical protein
VTGLAEALAVYGSTLDLDGPRARSLRAGVRTAAVYDRCGGPEAALTELRRVTYELTGPGDGLAEICAQRAEGRAELFETWEANHG